MNPNGPQPTSRTRSRSKHAQVFGKARDFPRPISGDVQMPISRMSVPSSPKIEFERLCGLATTPVIRFPFFWSVRAPEEGSPSRRGGLDELAWAAMVQAGDPNDPKSSISIMGARLYSRATYFSIALASSRSIRLHQDSAFVKANKTKTAWIAHPGPIGVVPRRIPSASTRELGPPGLRANSSVAHPVEI
jgi:hypothetical protein